MSNEEATASSKPEGECEGPTMEDEVDVAIQGAIELCGMLVRTEDKRTNLPSRSRSQVEDWSPPCDAAPGDCDSSEAGRNGVKAPKWTPAIKRQWKEGGSGTYVLFHPL